MSQNLLSLLQLSDTALPIGGFSHSAGLETYVQQGLVQDKCTAEAFVTEMLSRSIHFTDAAFLSLAYDAKKANNLAEIIVLDEECSAVKLPMEMRQASQKLGSRMAKIFSKLCDDTLLRSYTTRISSQEAAGNHAVVFGLCAAALGVAKRDALEGFYYNAAAALVTNCVKLIPLGQQDGQELLFAAQPLLADLAEKSLEPDRKLIGLSCTAFDIASMQHEQLYSRLYMS